MIASVTSCSVKIVDPVHVESCLRDLRDLGVTATFVPGVGTDFDFNFVPGDGCFYGVGVMEGWHDKLIATPYTLQIGSVGQFLNRYGARAKEVRRVVAAHIKAKGGEDKALAGYRVPRLRGGA